MAIKIYNKGGTVAIEDGNKIVLSQFGYYSEGDNITILDKESDNETWNVNYSDIQNSAGGSVGASVSAVLTYLGTLSTAEVTSSTETSASLGDPKIQQAENVAVSTYGDVINVQTKAKNLLKFGRNKLVNVTKSTLMTLPVGIDNETLVASNLITQVSSSSGSDTGNIIIEGHTSSDGLTFAFSKQTVTLTGQTAVTLATPIARVSRVVNDDSTDLVGNIYVAQTDSLTSGVPDTDVKVHCIVEAGLNNSEKAATTTSSSDYWIITSFYSDCLEKTSAFGTVHLEVRESGKTFINKVDISASTNSPGRHDFNPYLIVPKNSDIRMRISASAAGKDFSGGIDGMLASVTV